MVVCYYYYIYERLDTVSMFLPDCDLKKILNYFFVLYRYYDILYIYTIAMIYVSLSHLYIILHEFKYF